MKISGAIFDMDGTLTDSMWVWEQIGNRYLNSCGIDPKENVWQRVKSMTMRQTAEFFISEYGLKKTVTEIYSGIYSLLEPIYRDEVFPKKGVELLLERLKSQGVRMCVATATDYDIVKMVLEKNGLLGYFSEIFTCRMVGAGKESPLIYEKALEHLGSPKEETYVFEDAFHAVKTAKEAGFTVVGVFDSSTADVAAEIKASADYFIEDYRQDYLLF